MNNDGDTKVFYFVVEGIDGSGKSAVSVALKKLLEGQGLKCDLFKGPSYDGPIGNVIRQWFADRVQLANNSIMYAMVADAVDQEQVMRMQMAVPKHSVVLDRHQCISGPVYQRNHHTLKRCLDAHPLELFVGPSALIYLDVEPAQALKWREKREPKETDNQYTSTTEEGLDVIRKRYETILNIVEDARWAKVVHRIKPADHGGPGDVAHAVLKSLGIRA